MFLTSVWSDRQASGGEVAYIVIGYSYRFFENLVKHIIVTWMDSRSISWLNLPFLIFVTLSTLVSPWITFPLSSSDAFVFTNIEHTPLGLLCFWLWDIHCSSNYGTAKSNYITSTLWPASTNFVKVSKYSIRFFWHDLLFMNPCWEALINSLAVRCCGCGGCDERSDKWWWVVVMKVVTNGFGCDESSDRWWWLWW